MESQNNSKPGKLYLYSVILFMFALPFVSVFIDFWTGRQSFVWWMSAGKWFVFWSVGLRLLIAGIRQIINPAYTAKEIFHLQDQESYVIIKELGFANVCLGTISTISLFIPEWRIASAVAGGLFFGLAGANHVLKKPVGTNEVIAMVSDIFIFLVMLVFVVFYFSNK